MFGLCRRRGSKRWSDMLIHSTVYIHLDVTTARVMSNDVSGNGTLCRKLMHVEYMVQTG